MGLRVSPAELTREWSLSFADIDFVNTKPTGSRLGLASQLKFFAAHGYFATAAAEISEEAVSYLADQLGVGKADLEGYDFSGRSGRRHCAEILRHLGFRRMKRSDRSALAGLDSDGILPQREVGRRDARGSFLWCRITGFSARRARRWNVGALGAAMLRGFISWRRCGSPSLGNGCADGSIADRSGWSDWVPYD